MQRLEPIDPRHLREEPRSDERAEDRREPSQTAGTAPIMAAAPDSKAPSSFDALMNTISTALTRAAEASGVASAVIIERMFMLIMSAKPPTARGQERERERAREPEDDHAGPEDGDDDQELAPRHPAQRPARQRDPGQQRADRRSAAQEAEPHGADVEDVAREHRQQRHGAAEHGDEVERDRAEQHRRPPHEAEPGEQGRQPGAAGLER